MAVDHYENFPVASWLCPATLRRPIIAIYWFARTADDLADEGPHSPKQRLDELHRYAQALDSILAGEMPNDNAWPTIFGPLRTAIRSHDLPAAPLRDLLSAFKQDVVQQRWPDRESLLDYCRRSANPVGRLLLHLYGCTDATSLAQSDKICTALQLINFWQDLSIDLRRGRLYVPRTDLQRHGLGEQDMVAALTDSATTQKIIQDLTQWARTLMLEGAPLVHRVQGRLGWELRLVVQGGLRILEKIDHKRGATLNWRPTLTRRDVPALLWRAYRM